MVAADLHQMINNVTKAGFRIISLISNNNIINRNSFKLLSGRTKMCAQQLGKFNQKTFDFPDMTDKNTILAAYFSHFEVMYNMEHTSLVKEATMIQCYFICLVYATFHYY